jgi:hypothetical protein
MLIEQQQGQSAGCWCVSMLTTMDRLLNQTLFETSAMQPATQDRLCHEYHPLSFHMLFEFFFPLEGRMH